MDMQVLVDYSCRMLGCSQRTTETVIKRWTTVTKISGKAIVAM
jgi:hypothetical protein